MKKTNPVEQLLINLAKVAMPELEAKMHRTCAESGVAIFDVVGDSFSYVARGVLGGEVAVPQTVSDLRSLMAKKAIHLLKDARRSLKTTRGRVSVRAIESLDKVVDDCGREVEQYASYESWRDSRMDTELEYQYMVCREVLKRVMAKRHISSTNQSIFEDVILRDEPRAKVAVRYSTTRNRVDQVVFRVMKWLKDDGLRLFRELYDQAA